MPPYREAQQPPGPLEGAFTRAPSAVFRTCYSSEKGDVPCSEPRHLEAIGYDVPFGFFPAWPPEIADFDERLLNECLAAQPAYVTELPPGYGVAALFPGPDLFDPTLEFTAACFVGPLGEDPAAVVGSIRD